MLEDGPKLTKGGLVGASDQSLAVQGKIGKWSITKVCKKACVVGLTINEY